MIRPAGPDDRNALIHINLLTGDRGQDASHLYSKPELMAQLYSLPYFTLRPELSFVLEINGEAVGYVTGCADTEMFAQDAEERWWPALREAYEPSDPTLTKADRIRINQIHAGFPVPKVVSARYPAHLHMNILPRAQGQGWGRRLFDHWCATLNAPPPMHVGVNAENPGGIAFWQALGFQDILGAPGPARYLGLTV